MIAVNIPQVQYQVDRLVKAGSGQAVSQVRPFQRIVLVLAVITINCLCFCLSAAAQSAPLPTLMNYQGRLMKANGAAVPDGPYQITIRVYDDLVSTDSSHLRWSETQTVVAKSGVFAVLLGQVTPLTSAVFSGGMVYLEIQEGNKPPYSPRQPIVCVPYAFRSVEADLADTVKDGAITNPKLADDAVSGAKIANSGVGAGKLDWTGSTAGQALTSTGSGVNWANPIAGSLKLPMEINIGGSPDGFGLGIYNTTGIAITGLTGIQGWDQPLGFTGTLGMTYAGKSAGVYGGSGYHFHDFWSGTYGALATSGLVGVVGSSERGAGVWGIGSNTPDNTSLNVIGVKGTAVAGSAGYFSNTGFDPTVQVRYTGTDGGHWNIYSQSQYYPDGTGGNGVYITTSEGKVGLQVVGGSKQAVVATSTGARSLYCEEATEVMFADYGFGQLKDGMAVITIDPVFAETVVLSQPYHVFITSYGDAEIYVLNRTAKTFEVHARSGEPNAQFSYRIVATRKGFENKRLERAPWSDTDPNLYPGKPDADPKHLPSDKPVRSKELK